MTFGQMATDIREWAVVYLKGFCMGMADAVPGVSGGTIALITGIYERLIGAITAIESDRILQVVSGVHPRDRNAAWEALEEMDALFLAVVGAGIVTAILTVTGAVDYAVHAYPIPRLGSSSASSRPQQWCLLTSCRSTHRDGSQPPRSGSYLRSSSQAVQAPDLVIAFQ